MDSDCGQAAGSLNGFHPAHPFAKTAKGLGTRTDECHILCPKGCATRPQYTFDANNHMVGFSYDAAGNLVNDGYHTYTYDAEGRVTAVDGGSTDTYVYDALGRRVRRSFQGTAGTMDFVLDLNGRPITEINGNTSAWQRSELFAGETHVATYADGITYFFHPDWLGSVRAESKYDGTLAGSMTNLPFGDGQAWAGRLPSWANFAEGDIDEGSYLNLFMFRQYSNVQGRWIMPDPAGMAAADPSNPQSWNRYAYVMNNPLSFTDPDGLGCDPGNGAYTQWCPKFYENADDPFGLTLPGQSSQEPDNEARYLTTIPWYSVQGGELYSRFGFYTPNREYDPEVSGSLLGTSTSVLVDMGPLVAANNDVPVGMDIFHNSPQCPNCANIWRNANQVTDPRTIALWYGASAVVGYTAYDVSLVHEGRLFGTRLGGNNPLLNSNDVLRVGWSYIRATGEYTFRIGGDVLNGGHINLWPPSWWF